MANVDPFVIQWPKQWEQDPEIGPVVHYLNRFLHDLWIRTGGGDDAIAATEVGELYEPGIASHDIEDIISEFNDIQYIDTEEAQEIDSEILHDLLERVRELEIESTMWHKQELEDMDAKNFYYEVAAGRIPGVDNSHIFGNNADIDIASGSEDIWDGGGLYTGFNATAAETVELFSSDANDTSAGTGARTVQIYGLDGSFNEQTETVTLNGVTAVNTANTYIRLNEAVVRTAGSGGVNAGTITIRQNVTTANVFGIIQIGNNNTLNCVYTIPAGKKAYLTSWGASLSGSVKSTCVVKLSYRPESEVFQLKEVEALSASGSTFIHHRYDVPKDTLTAKTDIKLSADADVDNTGVSATMDIILEDI